MKNAAIRYAISRFWFFLRLAPFFRRNSEPGKMDAQTISPNETTPADGGPPLPRSGSAASVFHWPLLKKKIIP